MTVTMDDWQATLTALRRYTDASRKALEQLCRHPEPHYRCEHCGVRFCLRCAKAVGEV